MNTSDPKQRWRQYWKEVDRIDRKRQRIDEELRALNLSLSTRRSMLPRLSAVSPKS